MKSLYAKLLTWSLATMAITGLGIVAVSMWTAPERGGLPAGRMRKGGGGGPGLRRFAPRQMEVARRAWENGGPEALRNQLDMMRAFTGVELALTDAEGKDLLTGESHAGAITRLRLHRALPALIPPEQDGQAVNGIASPDGRYWLLFFRPAGEDRFPLRPAHVWVFLCAAVFSFFLARNMTAPVRQLQGAVERFGGGDLGARVNSARSDEFGKLGRAFDEMAGRIQTLVQAERRLLVDISHELRSPLTRLGLAVELARTGEDREAALDRIQREADRLNSLVSGLLLVNRGEADPSAMQRAPLRIEELVEAVADDCRLDAEARGVRIEVRKTGPATVEGDAELLRRVVENVLRNAVRYSPPGEAIDAEVSAVEGEALVAIRDRGPGVPDSALPHLFDAFYRVRDSAEQRQDGFGLGLSIARRAVELHRGSIRAENARPGLRVEIRLPR